MPSRLHERAFFSRGVKASNWSIDDFKSIEHACVSLNPSSLTVLTGTNSIGKSSLLQSLLMLCQSVNNYGYNLVLNGPLARLGVPEDVVRAGKHECRISVEYNINARARTGVRAKQRLTVNAGISLCPLAVGDKTNELSTLVVSGIKFDFSINQSIYICTSDLEEAETRECKKILKLRDTNNLTILKVINGSQEKLTRTYVAFRGLQPIFVIKLRSEDEAYKAHKDNLANFMSSGLRYSGPDEMLYLDAIAKELLPPEHQSRESRGVPTRIFARQYFRQLSEMLDNKSPEEIDEIADKTARFLAQNSDMQYRHIITPVEDRFLHYSIDEAEGDVDQKDDYHLLVTALINLSEALDDIALRIAYIGPLRDDPRVISPLTEETGNNLPIGAKGERTAAVLLANYRKESHYGLPDRNKPKRTTLGEAVNAWSQYLGVGNTIHAANKQKLGVSINISSGGTEMDLTQVGVGASQAIPILVGVLNAEPKSIIVIEQPELHLHPSAQAKLADFLLFARPDVTVLVESHSEALVTRLRRRVVENERLAQKIDIQFFAKDGNDGGVIGHALEIDEYGNLDSWPQGFMDAVLEDSRVIMKTALSKRKEKRGNND